jgi:hypothetical protein
VVVAVPLVRVMKMAFHEIICMTGGTFDAVPCCNLLQAGPAGPIYPPLTVQLMGFTPNLNIKWGHAALSKSSHKRKAIVCYLRS